MKTASSTSDATLAPPFRSLAELRAACLDLPEGDSAAAAAVMARQAELTKPPGSLGRLEEIVAWLAKWGRNPPQLARVDILVFAGNHGVTAHGVSPFPAAVTAQMVANFSSGGAAINQLAQAVSAKLRVIPLDLEKPTADFTREPAMDEASFVSAVAVGYGAARPDADLICLGEMGIGNTTAAAALAASLFGGDGARWAGRGTGVDDKGLARKQAAIDKALAQHANVLDDPLLAAAALGGRELAAILGATLAARHRRIPVLLDGFACTAAAAPLAKLRAGALDHAQAAHVSAEAAHRALLDALKLKPLLDLGMRLGEGSGAALAVSILRAALACHLGMATFVEAGVANKPH
ncbi:MAG: nicotinate-nucleotide--dimethylbenzimidazole phosphoribosyltransferase [Alphaproteobacteria bacterium]|jgi:nicotinate-nucleotide--dimethylbenzimidazole phosphoribosyltransferase|nr:nicotinate-nucleotide--dimethylbenzimidazole phosphoribosyltransferase [Alphaproteobacteria bacterium]